MCRSEFVRVFVAACLVAALGAPGARCAMAPGGTQGIGTAVVISPEGHLITCAHVAEDAAEIHVRIQEVDYPAAVLAVDKRNDLALLKVQATGLQTARLATDTPQLGQHVWAFGFPLAPLLGDTVKVTGGAISGLSTRGTRQVLQIDAAVNPGNSGGPLVDETGAVVGIVNAKFSEEIASDVAFAIPIGYVRSFLRRENVTLKSPAGAATKPGGTAKGAAPMDGPALAKAISPAVALVVVRMAGPVAIRTVPIGGDTLSSFALSPDGRLLACSGGQTRTVTLWDVATGELVRTLALPDTEGYRRALASEGGRNSWISGPVFSPDGATLSCDNPPMGVVSWDVKSGRPTKVLPTGILGTPFYLYSPDGQWLLHGASLVGADVEALNLRTGQARRLTARCSGAAVSADSRQVAIAYSARPPREGEPLPPAAGVQLVDLASGTVTQTLKCRTTGVRDVSFSPDGRWLAGVDRDPDEYLEGAGVVSGVGVVTIWDLKTGAVARTLSYESLVPGSVCFAPRGAVLAVNFSAPSEGSPHEDVRLPTVVLWDTDTWEQLATLYGELGDWSHTAAFSTDGELLATMDWEQKTVTVWRIRPH